MHMPTNKAVFIIEETEIVLILKLFFYLKRSIYGRYVASLISDCGQILRIYWEALQNFLDESRVDSYLYPDYFRRFNFNLFRSRSLCCCQFTPRERETGGEREEKKRNFIL